jgi:hypothetical protein
MDELDEYVYEELEQILCDKRKYINFDGVASKTEEEVVAIDSGVKLGVHSSQTNRVDGYFSHCRFMLRLTGENLEKYLAPLQEAIDEILQIPNDCGGVDDSENEDIWFTDLDRENNDVIGDAFGHYQTALGDVVSVSVDVGDYTFEAYVTEDALDDEELLEEQLMEWWWPQARESEKKEIFLNSGFEVSEE